MKFSVDWLKQLSNSKLKAQQIAELLSEHTAEAEVIAGQVFPGIIVAEVTKVDKHPNADRLRVITLTDGAKTYAPVVCGAWNFDVGARVILALPGATIPHNLHDPEGKPFVLAKATIRGIESQGMLCSGKELGLSDDGKGIMLLDKSQKLGEEFSPGGGDEVFDISAFAHRPDLHSHLGVAREISALTGTKLSEPSTIELPKPDKAIDITIQNSDICSYYSALKISQVKFGPTPEFILERLKASGLRPVNNIVDIVNYAMLLTGQPMHAFDAAKIQGGIVVRRAQPEEKFLALDNVERALNRDILVIADREKVLAVAGVIGGMNSGVTASTENIILEAATFNNVSIRKASRALNVRTDSSIRFEKSIPSSYAKLGMEVAAALLKEHAFGKIEHYAVVGKPKDKTKPVEFTDKQISGLLGIAIPAAEQKQILTKFGLKITGASAMKATPPDWRQDLNAWEDLAEEIIRFKGLNSLPSTPPAIHSSAKYTDPSAVFQDKVANLLAQMGLSEIYTYSFTSESNPASLEVDNPLNDEQKYLRTGILTNMAQVAELNSRYFERGAYFELGNIYRKGSGKFVESTKLGILCYSKNELEIKYLNGVIMGLAQKLGMGIDFLQIENSSADVLVNGRAAGTSHVIPHKNLHMVGASLDISVLMEASQPNQFEEIPKFPHKVLDTSIVVSEKSTWAEVKKTAGSHALLKTIEATDIYRGPGIPSHKKSLTIRATYQSPERTLTDQEVETLHQEIIQKIAQKLGGQVRN